MDQNRILELAIEALEKQKAQVEQEISYIRTELTGRARATGTGVLKQAAIPATTPSGRRRKRTPAERKAHSAKMKAYWAAKKAEAAGKATQIKTTAKRSRKRSPKA